MTDTDVNQIVNLLTAIRIYHYLWIKTQDPDLIRMLRWLRYRLAKVQAHAEGKVVYG